MAGLVALALMCLLTFVAAATWSDTAPWPILILIIALGSAFIAFVALSVGILVNLAYMMLAHKEGGGMFGWHRYQVDADGLQETTASNSTLVPWSAISKILLTRDYIFVRLNSPSFHIINTRAFESTEHLNAFWSVLNDRWHSRP